MENNQKFVKGIYFNERKENQPEYVVGRIQLYINDFLDYIRTNREYIDDKLHLTQNGKKFLVVDVKSGHKGIYLQVNEWKPEKKEQEQEATTTQINNQTW